MVDSGIFKKSHILAQVCQHKHTHTHTQKIHEFIYCTILHACMFPQRPGSRDEAPTGNVRSVETSPDKGNRQETQEVRLDYLLCVSGSYCALECQLS